MIIRAVTGAGACLPQVRLAAAEERAARAEWEGRDAAQAASRDLAAARAEAAEWKREAQAAEAERAHLATSAKLARRGSTSSFGGTPRARGERAWGNGIGFNV